MWVAFGIAAQVCLILALRRLGVRLLWCALAPLLAIIVFGIGGLVVIGSELCTLVGECGTTASIAFLIDTLALLLLAALISLATALGVAVRARANAASKDEA